MENYTTKSNKVILAGDLHIGEESVNVEEAFRTLTKVMWNYQQRRQ